MRKTTYIILIVLLVFISGCTSYENENLICKAMFSDGAYKVQLNETVAETCDEYAGAMTVQICKGAVFCDDVESTCFCFHAGDTREETRKQQQALP